jgi:ATP diphosphatase
VLAKIREEADEIEAALDAGDDAAVAGEVGDLLFAVVNLARHVDADPETALRAANGKFERRFGYIETALAARGTTPAQSTIEAMDALWNEAKRAERARD